jgi:vacuolar-type H+-ATPase subunit E/Vma4
MQPKAILAGISAKGKEKIKTLNQEAELNIKNLLAQAHKDSEIIAKRILSEGKNRAFREQAIIDQQTSLRVLQARANARHQLTQVVLEEVKKRLSKVRLENQYPVIMKALVLESIEELRFSLLAGQKILLHIDVQDQALVEQIIKTVKDPIRILSDIKCWGGCNAESDDGKINVLNTVEARYEKGEIIFSQQLSLFFESKTT